MKTAFKILLTLTLMINLTPAYGEMAQPLKKITGQDTLAVLAATCGEKNWNAFKKWSGLSYYRSLEGNTPISRLSENQIDYAEQPLSITATPQGLVLKSQAFEVKGADFCELILNVDRITASKTATKKAAAWWVQGFLTTAQAAEEPLDVTRSKQSYMKAIVTGVAAAGFACASVAGAATIAAPVAAPVTVPVAAVCGVVGLGASLTRVFAYGFGPPNSWAAKTATVPAQIDFNQGINSTLKLISCAPNQIVIEDDHSRLIASKNDKTWSYDLIGLNRKTLPTGLISPALESSRAYMEQIVKHCKTQADVDRINAEVKIFKNTAKERLAQISIPAPASRSLNSRPAVTQKAVQ